MGFISQPIIYIFGEGHLLFGLTNRLQTEASGSLTEQKGNFNSLFLKLFLKNGVLGNLDCQDPENWQRMVGVGCVFFLAEQSKA